MKALIISIGNSKGIRLPKALLKQARFQDEVELEAHADRIVIRPAKKVRQNWAEAFKKMAEKKDDQLFDSITQNEWDAHKWQW